MEPHPSQPYYPISWTIVKCLTYKLAHSLSPKNTVLPIYGVPRGGQIVANMLSHANEYLYPTQRIEEAEWIVEDIIDTGKTIELLREDYRQLTPNVCALFHRHTARCVSVHACFIKDSRWIVFPWEDWNDYSTLLKAAMWLKSLD